VCFFSLGWGMKSRLGRSFLWPVECTFLGWWGAQSAGLSNKSRIAVDRALWRTELYGKARLSGRCCHCCLLLSSKPPEKLTRDLRWGRREVKVRSSISATI
jgi:hypothetical protein